MRRVLPSPFFCPPSLVSLQPSTRCPTADSSFLCPSPEDDELLSSDDEEEQDEQEEEEDELASDDNENTNPAATAQYSDDDDFSDDEPEPGSRRGGRGAEVDPFVHLTARQRAAQGDTSLSGELLELPAGESGYLLGFASVKEEMSGDGG